MEQIDQQRIQVLLQHWRHHNEEHAHSYEEWADRLQEGGWSQVADLLQEASRLTRTINSVLDDALAKL